MKMALRHTIVLVAVFLGALSLAAVREATVKRNVNLRSDPSTDNSAIELIRANPTVTLLDPAPQNGYYHVQAEDGQEGWVWGRNVSGPLNPEDLRHRRRLHRPSQIRQAPGEKGLLNCTLIPFGRQGDQILILPKTTSPTTSAVRIGARRAFGLR